MASDDKGKAKDLLDWLGVRAVPDFIKARWLGALVGVVLALLFGLALLAAGLVMVHTIGQALTPAAEGPNLGAGALIAALLGAPFVIWGTWLKWQTVRYQKEGHMTDRINKAVEQLGAERTVKTRGKDGEGKDITIEETQPNLEVRIGAILSLERIAQDSTTHDKGRDHVRVMEILCAYIRENSNARKPVDFPEPEWEPLRDGATEEEREAHLQRSKERFGDYTRDSKAWTWAQDLPKPRADVAQALMVILRRSPAQRRVEAAWPDPPQEGTVWPFDLPCPQLPDDAGEAALSKDATYDFKRKLERWRTKLDEYQGHRLDLTGANLQRADLHGYPGSDMGGLAGALLRGVRLEGANLRSARLEGAQLAHARLEGTNLRGARIAGANLASARMEGAELGWARLEGAYLEGTRLEAASLVVARFEGASLGSALLEQANLAGVRLQGADLKAARLERAALEWARMERADLGRARLEGATLGYARMEGTLLGWTQLDGAYLRSAQFDHTTTWTKTSLRGAAVPSVDFSATSIFADQVTASFGDGSTTLPEGMLRPAHWPAQQLGSNFDVEWEKWRAESG